MTNHRHDIVCTLLILFISSSTRLSLQSSLNVEHDPVRPPQTNFDCGEYSECPDDEDKRRAVQAPPEWNPMMPMNRESQLRDFQLTYTTTGAPTHFSDTLDPDIAWDSQWGSNLNLVQISAVTIDVNGNIVIFHRGDRTWGANTFDGSERFDPTQGSIRQNTIIVMDKSGKSILEWGSNMFYLPHGLTIDSAGNYWITDAAMHQVFKFDADDIKKHWDELKRQQSDTEVPKNLEEERPREYPKNLFENSIVKPSLILGVAFEPGNDDKRFCKPTAVAVQKNGDFFVSDGYCNSRIIKFNKNGERILSWGRHWGFGESRYQQSIPANAFFVPHALALVEEPNYILVADRENGRISCFFAGNGTFHREYKHPMIGTKIYSIAYAQEKIYLVNGADPTLTRQAHIRGFILDINTGNVLSQFEPTTGLMRPHDIAVTEDGTEIYVVDLDTHKIYRFLQGANNSTKIANTTGVTSVNRHEPAPLTDMDSKEEVNDGPTTATLVLSFVTAAIIFIALCVGIAAVVARFQKRGCLLTVRKRMRWEADRRENFKLSSLLEGRRGKGFKFMEKRPNTKDFRKLNTEPETSDEEHPENSLTKII